MANDITNNYSRVFQLIYEQDKISKQEIAIQLNLSLPTVTHNLKLLMNNDLIRNDGKFKSQVGRRAVAYSVYARKRVCLGLEMFKNYVTITAIDLKGTEIASDKLLLDYSNDDNYFQQLATWIKSFATDCGLVDDQVIGLGVGIQGLISYDRTTVLYGKILDCTGLKTARFEQFLPYKVSFFHDADCVAYAEHGKSDDHKDTIYLSIGEHLGTAIMINDRIYSGEQGRSGTMEHVTFVANSDRLCYCGRHGCVETYVSISSLLHDNENLNDFMASLAQNKANRARWETYLDYLAEAINNFHMFLDNRIVVAGELLQFINDQTLAQLKERIANLTAFPEDRPYLRLGSVLNHPVATGAAIPLMESFIESV
ncbi:NagC family transcriptional regulator [Levilactobacillus zymae]|uniref:NagC family transcriptional regulator n=1 Tax=Levilactobacillus zymae TaxID=267363 RepID=A0ABQ0X3S7_9LACO|nr:ROK family transcriptional regulator [Levilactobacillus zymae]KRL06762.1 ROK family protein [Levilactobacillus zymae DSM 19395]QFR62333.1 ROK family protein [Levilactobacillus zymae]GEO73072.1 NagC family transcriptional regulator [Levilactobacillus zymae]